MTAAAELRRQHNRQKGECTWCGGPVAKGRRSWCGPDCVNAFHREHNWAWIRQRVLDRDHGVCAMCGCDTLKMHRVIKIVRRNDYAAYDDLRRHWQSFGWRDPFTEGWWQADHILPRIRGGTHDMDNLRTLCVPCHKRETAKLAAHRAAERRDADRPLLQD